MSTLTHAPNMFSELTAAHTHNDELVALNGTLLVKIAQLEIERAHWKSQSEFEMRQAHAEWRVGLWEKKIAEEKDAEIAQLRADSDKLAAQVADLLTKNETLAAQNTNLKAEEIEDDLFFAEKQEAIDDLRADLETARREKQEMEQRVEEFREDWAATCRATADFRREKYELEDKVAKLERELRTYKADTKELEDELENLRKEEPTSVEYHRMEMDMEDLQEENAMLRHTIDNIRRAHSEDVDTLKKSKDVMRNDLVTEHNRVVEEFKKSETKLVGECCEMSNKVAELKELVEHMRSAIACLSGLVGK
jgi:DNA repair exonuclease SbcCD ATPase subunit